MIEREFPHAGVLRFAGRRLERWLDVAAVVLALDDEVTLRFERGLERARGHAEVHADAGAAEDVLDAIHAGRSIAAPQHDAGQLARGAAPRLDDRRTDATGE